ncbi:MAG: hypothetical protein ACO23H_03175 [Alphaproteobacteria bacterium]
MPKHVVKHFADDLNQVVDVPEHPSHPGINSIRSGQAEFLGKGDDGIVFDTGDGKVGKVTTSVPYNLAYFRDPQHAISDARRQAELNNQAISEGHDILVPQQFVEHGEKGFTFMPKLNLKTDLSRDQILAYREKLKAFHDAGYRINDQMQHGVDADGNIRIFDTGKLSKSQLGEDPGDIWDEQSHSHRLMREHGHYDHLEDSNRMDKVRKFISQGIFSPFVMQETVNALESMAENQNDELEFHADLLMDELVQHDNEESAFLIDHIDEVLEQRKNLTEDDLVDFQSWMDRNSSDLTFDDDYGNGNDKYISPGGDLIEQMEYLDVDLVPKLAAMNPGVQMSMQGNQPSIHLLGHPTKEQLIAIEDWVEANDPEVIDISIYDESGEQILVEQIEPIEQEYSGEDVSQSIHDYFAMFPVSQERRMRNVKAWAEGSKLVDGSGMPIVLYHGTQRPDRIGDRFRSDRATSASMAYFTTNPEVASSYAENKSDTSLEIDSMDQIANAFTIDGVPMIDAWRQLSEGDKEALYDKLGKVYYDYDQERYILDNEGGNAPIGIEHLVENADNPHYMGSFENPRDRRLRGNLLASLFDSWIGSGMLHPHDRYTELREILDAAGIDKSRTRYDDPYGKYSAVFPVYIDMKNPLISTSVPKDLSQAILDRAETEAIDWESEPGADIWDKRTKEPRMWASTFWDETQGALSNKNGYVWTSIPDWATEVFKQFGYDGIIDQGNKGGGKLDHEVVIPFEDRQVKSATGNFGRFSDRDERITYAAADELEGQSDEQTSQPATAETATEPSAKTQPEADPIKPTKTDWKGLQTLYRDRQADTKRLRPPKQKEIEQQRQEAAIDPKHFELHNPEGGEQQEEASNAILDKLKQMHVGSSWMAQTKDPQLAYQMLQQRKNEGTPMSLGSDYERYKQLDMDEVHKLASQAGFNDQDDDYLYHIQPTSHDREPGVFAGGAQSPLNLYDRSQLQREKTKMTVQSMQNRSEMQKEYEDITQRSNELGLSVDPEYTETLENKLQHHELVKSGKRQSAEIFRIHKSKLQDFAASTGSHYVADAYIKEKVRQSTEKSGYTERQFSEASQDYTELRTQSDELTRKVNTASSERLLAERAVMTTAKQALESKEKLEQPLWETSVEFGADEQGNSVARLFVDVLSFESEDNDEITRTPTLATEVRMEPDDLAGFDEEEAARTIVRTAKHEQKLALWWQYDDLLNETEKEEHQEAVQLANNNLELHNQEYRDLRLIEEIFQKLVTNQLQVYRREIGLETLPSDAEPPLATSKLYIEAPYELAQLQKSQNPEVRVLAESIDSYYRARDEAIGALTERQQWSAENRSEFNEARSYYASAQFEMLQSKVATNPQYWRWAGDNKTLDQNGMPLIIFHGTMQGGFERFSNLDVYGHVYGSTNPYMASSYSGYETTDVTPALANDMDDVRDSVYGSNLQIREKDGVMQLHSIDQNSNIFECNSEEDFVLLFNDYLLNKKPNETLSKSGVYPLVYRLENPLVIEGYGANWSQIDLYSQEEAAWDEHPVQLDRSPVMQAMLDRIARDAGLDTYEWILEFIYNENEPTWAEEIERLVEAKVPNGNIKERTQYALTEYLEKLEDLPNYYERPAMTVQAMLLSGLESSGFEGFGGEEATTRELAELAEFLEFDGIIFKQIVDYSAEDEEADVGVMDYPPGDVYVSFSTNQVKSAYSKDFLDDPKHAERLTYQAQ